MTDSDEYRDGSGEPLTAETRGTVTSERPRRPAHWVPVWSMALVWVPQDLRRRFCVGIRLAYTPSEVGVPETERHERWVRYAPRTHSCIDPSNGQSPLVYLAATVAMPDQAPLTT